MGLVGRSGAPRGAIRRRVGRILFHCLVWSLVIVVLVPLLWPLMMSLHGVTVPTLLDQGVRWWLAGVDVDVFVYTALSPALHRLIGNSVLVATLTGIFSAAIATTGAYALDRFEFAGRRPAAWLMLVLLMVPQAIVVIPLFIFFHTIGLHDTRIGLVVAYVAFTLPFTTWLLYPMFSRIPRDYEQAAMVDGCTRLGAFLRVFLPLAKPPIAAAFVLAWILAYNEFLYAIVLIDDPAIRTLPVGIRYGAGNIGVVAVLSTLPIVAIFAVLWWFFLAGDLRRFTD